MIRSSLIHVSGILLTGISLFPLGRAETILQAQEHPQAFQSTGSAIRITEELPRNRPGIEAESAAASEEQEDGPASVSTSGFSIDRMNRNAVAAGYQQYYMSSEDFASVIGWTGTAATCTEGTVSSAFQDRVLRRINYYRAQTGLLADISLDATKNAKSQQAALMMAANNALDHSPPTSWRCYSTGGAEAAGAGNLSWGTFGPRSIDGQIRDDGSNNSAVGHRRWLLYPEAQEMGSGSVPFNYSSWPPTYPEHNAASCVWVIGNFKANQPAVGVAWPNDGYVPWNLVPNDGETFPRWSYSYAGANFSNASVTLTQGGNTIPVTLENIATGFGDNSIVWRPNGIPDAAPAVDTPYVVTISGITGPISSVSYTVTLIDPNRVYDAPVISGPASPLAMQANSYNFSSTDQAESYELSVFEVNAGTWTEGAESSPSPQISDATDAGYTLISSYTSASGSRAFHLATPDFGEESFSIDRDIVPSASSQISFRYRRYFIHPDTKLRVELSLDGGSGYSTIHTIDGQNTSGSSAQWDSSFLSANINVPAQFVDKAVRLRFRLETTGSTYLGSSNTIGLYLDNISVSNSQELSNGTTQSIAGNLQHFDFTPDSAGQSYLLSLRPILGGHAFDYGPLLSVSSVAAPPAPVINSAATAEGAQGEVFSYFITASNSPSSFNASGLPSGAQVDTQTGEITGNIAPGTHNGISISATNASGTGNAALSIQILSGYEKAVADSYPSLGAPSEDDDNDGTPNIVELAIQGRNPLVADHTDPAHFTMTPGPVNVTLSLSKSGVPGLDYQATGTSHLPGGIWTNAGITVITDNASSLEVSYPLPLGPYFFRIEVSENNDPTSSE